MGISTSTGTLTAGQSRTFNLSPASAVTLTLSPNVRVTITESPAAVTATGLGGNATRVHEPRLPGTFTYGPYPMGGEVVVENGSNSGSSVAWVETSAVYTKDSSGNVTGLAGSGARTLGWSRNLISTPSVGFNPFGQNISSTNIGTVVGQTSSVVTLTDVITSDGPGVRAVCGTADKYIELQFALPYPMLIKQLGVLASANPTTQSALAIYAGIDSGYSQFISRGVVVNNGGGKDGYHTNGLVTAKLGGPSPMDVWVNGSALDLDKQLFTHIKVRCTPLAGQFADFTMVRFIANPAHRSRIAVVVDDGYTSCYTYAAPMLQSRGLRGSFGIIPDLIGASGYMTLRQLQELKANGHEILTHGPIGGSGSLTANYANATLAVADAVTSRQSLVDLGLITTDAEYATYIWPQGQYQFSTADTSLLDAMKAAGFTTGRVVQRHLSYSHSAAAGTNYGGLIAPIFGHSRSTTTSGAEDTEITNCTSAISYAAANGLDAVGMFHKFIADQGVFSVTTTLDIEVSRFATILDAIVTQIAAGKATNELFSNFSGK